jgi:aminoglycoside phosphotransferase (APT) family kinase protein
MPTISEVLNRIVHERAGPGARLLALALEPLRGGTSADEVVAARVDYADAAGRRGALRLVVKRLSGSVRREADVYRGLAPHALRFAPRVLAAEADGDATLLFLERAGPAQRWPWRRVAHAEAVLRTAAELHGAGIACEAPWDYERELRASAAATLERVEAGRRDPALPIDAASLRALRRVVGALDAIRRELLLGGPFAPTFIHGDLHPGNVVLAARGAGPAPVLLDWGRARTGSPLEDVASWLQTLACWEPVARARHDTLLGAYLRARGGEGGPGAPVRRACWLAGASNALAGATLHHLAVATGRGTPPPARSAAAWALREWLRIIRRADATWAGREPARGARARRRSPAPVREGPTPPC